MTTDQMKARIVELQGIAKQHENILLQISGAIQEYARVIAESEAKAKESQNAPDSVDDAQGV